MLLLLVAFEAWRAISLYRDLSSSRSALLSLREDLELDTLEAPEEDVLAIKARLEDASEKLRSARSTVNNDPLLLAASLLPWAGRNAAALHNLVEAAHESARTGLLASDVLLDFHHSDSAPGNTSIQNAMAFLQQQEGRMREVRASLDRLHRSAEEVPDSGLLGPLDKARSDLDEALAKLDGLVQGYERADSLLPSVLGYNGPRTYLVLPQNDTELFPSGGLISSYGIAVFDRGRLTSMQFEYFVNLFDRWQRLSSGEYVAPPEPLRNYLLRHVSWGLGEAGWYPDFPTTAALATDFVRRGGAPAMDGTIAIDLQFVEALLHFLGPVRVQAYGVTVDAENLSEVTLEQTRSESALPGSPGKAFLSALGEELLSRIFAVPRDKWVGLLKLLDRMARERHLQMQFADQQLQALGAQYGLDGAIVQPPGDFLMVADASVQSTKLNLILETSLRVDLQLNADGRAFSKVGYSITNPFPQWRQGRSPSLVRALMLEGVYGSYLRVLADPDASLREVWLNGAVVGAEQAKQEVGKMAFGRFLPVLPGETKRVEFLYSTPDVVTRREDRYVYSLYVQKEPGTRAIPLELSLILPQDATDLQVSLDGSPLPPDSRLRTDLRTDRFIEVSFRVE